MGISISQNNLARTINDNSPSIHHGKDSESCLSQLAEGRALPRPLHETLSEIASTMHKSPCTALPEGKPALTCSVQGHEPELSVRVYCVMTSLEVKNHSRRNDCDLIPLLRGSTGMQQTRGYSRCSFQPIRRTATERDRVDVSAEARLQSFGEGAARSAAPGVHDSVDALREMEYRYARRTFSIFRNSDPETRESKLKTRTRIACRRPTLSSARRTRRHGTSSLAGYCQL